MPSPLWWDETLGKVKFFLMYFVSNWYSDAGMCKETTVYSKKKCVDLVEMDYFVKFLESFKIHFIECFTCNPE